MRYQRQLADKVARYQGVNRRAFSLIELLAVIGIVTVIIGMTLANTLPAQAKSRDRRRLADLKLIQAALELYSRGESAEAYPYPAAIYTDPLFQKYLTKTPTDPHGLQYTYHAPACIKPSESPATQEAVVRPTKVGSQRELIGRGTSVVSYCDAGFGWVPYALSVNLETKIGSSTDVMSVVQVGVKQVVFSSKAPLY